MNNELKAAWLKPHTHANLKSVAALERVTMDAMVEKLLAVYEIYKNQQNV